MPKAFIELANGSKVTIEGSTEEVKNLLTYYGGTTKKESNAQVAGSSYKHKPEKKGSTITPGVDITDIVNQIKNSENADLIAERILDRSSAVDRILLPLYIVHEHMNNATGLTSGEISKITRDLGVPISQANVAHAFSGPVSRYIVGDKVRKKGIPVRYKLSRKGLTYIKSIITGNSNAS